jgi:hypothetical protein
MNASWLRKEVALKVEQRVQPTSACTISGSNKRVHAFDTNLVDDWKGIERFAQSQGYM